MKRREAGEPTEHLSFLQSVELFRGLPVEALASIAEGVSSVDLAAGETLFRQGDVGDGLFLVIEGRLAVLAETGTREGRSLGVVGPGECVGEGALLISGRRTASVRAETPACLLALSREAFERSASAYPGLRSVSGRSWPAVCRHCARPATRSSARSTTRSARSSRASRPGSACSGTRCFFARAIRATRSTSCCKAGSRSCASGRAGLHRCWARSDAASPWESWPC